MARICLPRAADSPILLLAAGSRQGELGPADAKASSGSNRPFPLMELVVRAIALTCSFLVFAGRPANNQTS